MIRLTIDDEARALSAWAHAETLYVGEDVIFAPRWATHVWKASDGHLYYANGSDLLFMATSESGPDRLKELY